MATISGLFALSKAYPLISFIVAVIFMSFSSLELYVQTILPWFIVLLIVVFLVLMIDAYLS